MEQERSQASLPLLTVEEAAKQLRISRPTAYRLIERGELPVVRFGRCIRVDPCDLPAVIEHHKDRGAA